MTNEKAKKILEKNIPPRVFGNEDYVEAYKMAIEALENLPSEDSLCYGCHEDCDKCESMAMMMI